MTSATSFSHAFSERMQALGLPVAPEPFEHFSQAVSNASQMAAVVGLLGDQSSVTELVRRTLGLEKLMVAANYNARAYTAGVISCLAFASGQVRTGGSPMADLFRFTFQHQLQFPGWQLVFMMNPALTDPASQIPHAFGNRARQAA
ncbi:hypothetical protein ACFOZ5_18920 [Marinobacter lacisalsi]|uniref:Uncharacterized protein n=1 Tax=Marinobacter lacisalsi TaxID=475979 RepID=A0ABV8QN15_9GAMM